MSCARSAVTSSIGFDIKGILPKRCGQRLTNTSTSGPARPQIVGPAVTSIRFGSGDTVALESVHSVHNTEEMSSAYVSGRVPARYERLVAKQARAAKTSKSDLVARYVIEKSLETEFPDISFRDSLSGREAYLSGHRVAVWEVVAVHEDAKTDEKTAEHFRWPGVLVRRALAYAKAFPTKSAGRVKEKPTPYRLLADENTSHRFVAACRRLMNEFAIVHIATWEDGSWLGLDDAALLIACAEHGLVLVAFDRATLPWHAGQVLRARVSLTADLYSFGVRCAAPIMGTRRGC